MRGYQMNYYKLLFSILLITVLILFRSISFAAGVIPLSIDLIAKPGETVNFKFLLTPTGSSEKVKIFLNQNAQQQDGSFSFKDVNPVSFPEMNWVSLPETISISPDKPTEIQGTIKVPLTCSGGTHLMAVIVQSQVDNNQKLAGVDFLINFAIRLKLKVNRPGLRPSAQIKDFSLNSEPLLKILLLLIFLPLPLSSFVTITRSLCNELI